MLGVMGKQQLILGQLATLSYVQKYLQINKPGSEIIEHKLDYIKFKYKFSHSVYKLFTGCTE